MPKVDNGKLLCYIIPQNIGISKKYVVTLTEKAAVKVKEILSGDEQQGRCLRLAVQGGGCSGFQYSLVIDDKTQGDSEFLNHGVIVLVDPASLKYVDGAEIDFEDNLMGGGFRVNNPNAKTSCGCGSSFSSGDDCCK